MAKKTRSSKSRQSSSSTTDDSDDEETLFHIETKASVLSSGPIATFFSLLGRAVVQVLEAGKRAVDAGIDTIAEEYEDEGEVPFDLRCSNYVQGCRIEACNGRHTGECSHIVLDSPRRASASKPRE